VPVEFQLREMRAQATPAAPMFHRWTLPDGSPWTCFYREGANYLLRFEELADFQVTADGQTVRGWPAPDVDAETVGFLFANQVLPLALSRQGKLVFHASAVEIDGHAVAFMGESGRGKSTLAASFATNGLRFLTDDGLIVESTGEQWQILPSHPSIRLWEDSERALMDARALRAPPVQHTAKSRFLAGNRVDFCDQPRPLHRVYFLGEDAREKPSFERLKPGEALIELLKHSFLLDIEERQMLAAHFEDLSNLVVRPIYYRLDFPRYFDRLAEVRQAIIQHASEPGDRA
jgi:hypothetical protein